MIPITTFLSHADEDKGIARKFVNELEIHNFNVFVAHDDIGIGEEWENKLKNEIYNRELFLVLLSENFKNANFTNHEVGIATAYNKRIFQIRIDNTEPYGFMSRYQNKKINPEIDSDEITKLANELMVYTEEGKKIIDELIKELHNSQSWPESNAIARKLFNFTNFTPEQINNIADTYLDNFEVNGSWTGPLSLELIEKNWNLVEQQFKEKLKPYLQRK